MRRLASLALAIAACASVEILTLAQGPPAAQAQAGAPIDLTGYWVSIVNEDWRWRMVTPPKGDYASVPINEEGRKVADTWTPAMDGRCEAYGAGGLMRMPTRVHITWQDDNTLKLETDAGTQTRLLHFGAAAAPAATERSLQGHSVATWEFAGGGRGGAGAGGGGRGGPAGGPPPGGVAPASDGAAPPAGGRGTAAGGRGAPRFGSLKVVTTNLRQGWLRKNGVPYSDGSVVTEYYDRFRSTNGDEWFFVTTAVNDPKYLQQEFVTSSHFKKEPDGSKWSPSACKTS
jgi:SH3-like domain-containing protein